MDPFPLSVVVATCNEKAGGYLSQMAQSYPRNSNIEYIVVDSGTEDQVLKGLDREDFEVLILSGSNRAQRLSFGLKKSQNPMVVFHHPRSLLDPQGLLYLLENGETLNWGGFTHAFDKKHLGLMWTSWYSNRIRPRIMKTVYLDHCIFFKKPLLDKEIPPVPIFEDSEISRILRRSGSPQILSFAAVTSAIRFESAGFLKQSAVNQVLKVAYHLGLSATFMNRIYEKKLRLNE